MTVLELMTLALVGIDPVEVVPILFCRPGDNETEIVTVTSPLARRIFQMCNLLCREMLRFDPRNVELVTRGNQLCSLLPGLFWLVAIEENPLLIYYPNRNLCKGWVVTSPDMAMFRQVPKLGAVSDLIMRLTEVVSGAYVPSIEPTFKPVADNEQVIGTIEQKWVQAVHLLALDVYRQIPVFGQDEFPGPAQDLEVQHTEYAIGILRQLFTIAIQDTVPNTRFLNVVTIREDWKMVVTETDLIGSPLLVILGSPQGKD